MKKILVTIAVVGSCAAVLLAMDFGRGAFTEVDAGGHKLRMLIAGSGSPTVVFESGGTAGSGGPLEEWERVQPAISQLTRTVSYDRAGTGLSEPGPKPRDARVVASELHTALHAAHIEPPYLLVGHSFGGPLNRVFAGMYPDEVAGMVLLDPTQEEFIEWNDAQHHHSHEGRSEEVWQDIQSSLNEAHESRVPPGAPVVLITAMGPRVIPDWVADKDRKEHELLGPVWLAYHEAWVERTPNAKHIVTLDSGHGIPIEQPDLVIKTVREMVEQLRIKKD